METLLMLDWLTQPFSTLLGAGMSAVGGLMNASSTQAINAANLQQQAWSAQGGYLPGLVDNANKAGLNPLAVLGSRGPNMAVQVGTNPGQGLEAAGRQLSQVDEEAHRLALQNAREEIAGKAAVNKNTMIRNAIQEKTYQDLMEGKTVSGPEPAKNTSVQGAIVDWSKDRTLPNMLEDLEPKPRLPKSVQPWDWMDFSDRAWSGSGDVWFPKR